MREFERKDICSAVMDFGDANLAIERYWPLEDVMAFSDLSERAMGEIDIDKDIIRCDVKIDRFILEQ